MPRKRIVSVAYSFKAENTDKLSGVEISALVRKVKAVSPDSSGNIVLVGEGSVTVTADDDNNRLTIFAPGNGESDGDITAVIAGQGLFGGGEAGDVELDVEAGSGISVTEDAVSLSTTFTDGRYVNENQVNSISTEMIQADAITIDKILNAVVGSINGVTYDGSRIDLVAGDNIIITPDDEMNEITLSCTGGNDNLGDHTANQNMRLNGHWLSGNGGNEGVFVANDGNAGVGDASPIHKLDVTILLWA